MTGEEWQVISPHGEGHSCWCVVRDNGFKGRPKGRTEDMHVHGCSAKLNYTHKIQTPTPKTKHITYACVCKHTDNLI